MWSTWPERAYSIRSSNALDDRALDRPEAVLEEERRERRLEHRGEHVAVLRSSGSSSSAGTSTRPRSAEPPVEPEVERHLGAARPRHDVGADLRHPPLRELRVALVERPRHRQLEHAVAEELEPLVRGRPVGRPRRVGEDVIEALLGERLDQPLELGDAVATGAR